jgi:acetyl/propionyl-CoA carboxylase alpha subunit
MPAGPGVRVDTATAAGDRVPPDYDPLIAKIMVHAGDRPTAIERLRRALDETEVGGLQTTLPFHRHVARDPSFLAAELSTGWVDEHWDGPLDRAEAVRRGLLAAALAVGAGTGSGGAIGALDGEVPGVATAEQDGHRPGSAWHLAGLADALDRWPAG